MTSCHGEQTHRVSDVIDDTTDDQRQLLQRLEQGDRKAFWELWQYFEDEVCFRQCYRLMRGNREDAEDALSSGRLKAHQQLPMHVSKIEHVNGWLNRLLYNHCIDMRRARERHDRAVCCVGDVDMIGGKGLSLAHESAENVALRQETMMFICHAIDNLPARLREPCRLRFLHEMPHREIAAHLHLSPGNVRKRLQQARVLLREQITAYLAGSSPGVWEPETSRHDPAERWQEPVDVHVACEITSTLDDASDPREPSRSGHVMTTLYNLIAALHEVFTPEEDELVVATVMYWLDAGLAHAADQVSA